MDKKQNISYRSLKISQDVVELVVKYAVLGVDGVAGLYKEERNSGYKPVKMSLDSEFPEVTVSVYLTYSCKAKNVCENIQKKVREDVMFMTGIALGAVNIKAEGIRT